MGPRSGVELRVGHRVGEVPDCVKPGLLRSDQHPGPRIKAITSGVSPAVAEVGGPPDSGGAGHGFGRDSVGGVFTVDVVAHVLLGSTRESLWPETRGVGLDVLLAE